MATTCSPCCSKRRSKRRGAGALRGGARAHLQAKLGCTPEAKGVPMGELPRSEKKTKRIFDSRY
ncbi:MAG: hypothetical protein ACLTSX_12915 [Collinsella sp.]